MIVRVLTGIPNIVAPVLRVTIFSMATRTETTSRGATVTKVTFSSEELERLRSYGYTELKQICRDEHAYKSIRFVLLFIFVNTAQHHC